MYIYISSFVLILDSVEGIRQVGGASATSCGRPANGRPGSSAPANHSAGITNAPNAAAGGKCAKRGQASPDSPGNWRGVCLFTRGPSGHQPTLK